MACVYTINMEVSKAFYSLLYHFFVDCWYNECNCEHCGSEVRHAIIISLSVALYPWALVLEKKLCSTHFLFASVWIVYFVIGTSIKIKIKLHAAIGWTQYLLTSPEVITSGWCSIGPRRGICRSITLGSNKRV